MNWRDIFNVTPCDEQVLAVNRDKEFMVGYIFPENANNFICDDGGNKIEYVTHWIPLDELALTLPPE